MQPVSGLAFEAILSSVEGWGVEWAWEEVMEWVEFQAWPWLLGDEPSDQRHVPAPPHQSPLPLPSVERGRQIACYKTKIYTKYSLPVALISSVYLISMEVSMPWPAPGQPGSFEASRGPQSWGGSRRGRWDKEGQRLPAEGRTCSVVQPHREALHNEKKYR